MSNQKAATNHHKKRSPKQYKRQHEPADYELLKSYLADFDHARLDYSKAVRSGKGGNSAARKLMDASMHMIDLCLHELKINLRGNDVKPMNAELYQFLREALESIIGSPDPTKAAAGAFHLHPGRGRYTNPKTDERDMRIAEGFRQKRIGAKIGNKKGRRFDIRERSTYSRTTQAIADRHGVSKGTVKAVYAKKREEVETNAAIKNSPAVKPLAAKKQIERFLKPVSRLRINEANTK